MTENQTKINLSPEEIVDCKTDLLEFTKAMFKYNNKEFQSE